MGEVALYISIGSIIGCFVCCIMPWIIVAALLSSGNPAIVDSYSQGNCTVLEVILRSDPCGNGKNEHTETRTEFHVNISETGKTGLAVAGKWGLRGRDVNQEDAYDNYAINETFECWYPTHPQPYPSTACTVTKSDRLIYDNFDGAEMLKQVFITAVVIAPVCCCFIILTPFCFLLYMTITMFTWEEIKYLINKDQDEKK